MADTLERLKSALAGRHAIQRELGRGITATVYLDEDLRHNRWSKRPSGRWST